MHHVLTFTPPAFTEVLRDVVVKSGQHLRLRCRLSSLPTQPYTVTWTKNQRCIENDENVTVVKEGCTLSLDLASTETADTGHYKCFVTCSSRQITCTAYVAVIGKKPVRIILSCCGNKVPFSANRRRSAGRASFSFCPIRKLCDESESYTRPKALAERCTKFPKVNSRVVSHCFTFPVN